MPGLRYANYLEKGIADNARFDLGSAINRDDSNYPYWMLRERLLSHGIELNTPDLNTGRLVEFELHMNAIGAGSAVPAFVLLMETEQILPDNASQTRLEGYRKIFTWNDDLVDRQRYIKVNFPNRQPVNHEFGWTERQGFCCLIAGNKSCARATPNDLYSERVRTIRWFEQHAPGQFDLYGSDWDILPPPPGWLGKLWVRGARLLPRLSGRPAFPSYRGRARSKLETLRNYRFSICYENVKDVRGYITEKIFDCFFAGCIPVYWGAPNVTDCIPRECFVDRRDFRDHEDLYRFIRNMTESEGRRYQAAIADFLDSEAARPFYAEAFVDTVARSIISGLKVHDGGGT